MHCRILIIYHYVYVSDGLSWGTADHIKVTIFWIFLTYFSILYSVFKMWNVLNTFKVYPARHCRVYQKVSHVPPWGAGCILPQRIWLIWAFRIWEGTMFNTSVLNYLWTGDANQSPVHSSHYLFQPMKLIRKYSENRHPLLCNSNLSLFLFAYNYPNLSDNWQSKSYSRLLW